MNKQQFIIQIAATLLAPRVSQFKELLEIDITVAMDQARQIVNLAAKIEKEETND